MRAMMKNMRLRLPLATEELMINTECLLSTVAREVLGTYEFEYQGHQISFEAPFDRIPMKDAVLDANFWIVQEDGFSLKRRYRAILGDSTSAG